MQALDRILGVLTAVAEGEGDLSASQIASITALPLSTTARLIKELEEAELLASIDDGQRYTIGPRLFVLARKAADRDSFRRDAYLPMRRLRNLTRETVSLHIRAGSQRICLAEVRSQQPIARAVPVGLELPLVGTATGEALLAFAQPQQRDEIVSELPAAETGQALAERLTRIRDAGYATRADGRIEGVAALAVPVLRQGHAAHVLTISGPSHRLSDDALHEYIEAAETAAAEISAYLTG